MRALAGVFLAAGVRTALQALALADGLLGDECAGQGRSCLAISFSNNFIAHDLFPLGWWVDQTLYCR